MSGLRGLVGSAHPLHAPHAPALPAVHHAHAVPGSATHAGSATAAKHTLASVAEAAKLFLPSHLGRVVVSWHWVLGVSLAVAAQFVSNLGLNLQRQSHIEDAALPESRRRRMTLRPKWVLGLLLIAGGSFGDLAALTFAAQSLVATLGSLTMVSNVLFAPLLLGERLTSAHLHATGIILLGCTVVVVWGPHESEIYHIDTLMSLYMSSTFVSYAIVVIVVCSLIYTSIQWIEREYLISESPLTYRYPKAIRQYHHMSYAALSGIVGAQSVLLGKGFAEMVKSSFAGRGFMFSHLLAYIIIPAMGASVVLQIRWLNSGIKRFGLLQIVPIFQTFWTVVSVIGGLVVYNEWKEFTVQQGMVFMIGITITLYGVTRLSQIPSEASKRAAPGSGTHKAPVEAEPFLGDTLETRVDGPPVWMGNSGEWTVQSSSDARESAATSAGGPAGVLSQINDLGDLDLF